jgi:hypothetical protein
MITVMKNPQKFAMKQPPGANCCPLYLTVLNLNADLENTLNVRRRPDMLKAVFPLNFMGGMLEVHARQPGIGVVNEQRTNRAEEL